MIIYPIPGKYDTRKKFDISIIIPMYKSLEVIADQIKRLPTIDAGLSVEIIYVDDRCPEHSSQAVMKQWNKRRDKNNFNVRLLLNQKNLGFGGACNAGAHIALGKYLIFLNADAVPNPNWLWPIFETFENDPQAGIVGNLQLKEGGEWHGTIDSAGSEWYWGDRNFVHIGRHILNGEIIDAPLKPSELQMELCEREMVTGCCFGIPADLFKKIGGFNHYYRKGYWEDSEINMVVRELGYKVLFQPDSVVWHKLSHSNIAKHDFHDINKQFFINKWESSGRLEKLVKAKRPIKRTDPKLILVKRDAANGDVLLAAGVCSALKKKFPGCVIHFCTGCQQMVQKNPFIDYITDPIEAFNNLHRYQLTIELDGAYERRPTVPLLETYAEAAGIEVKDMEFFMHSQEFGPLPDSYIVIHSGITNWVGRNWSTENFETIAQNLLDLGHHVICIGRGGDRLVPCTTDLRSKINLYEMAHVIKNSKYYIGIDSMPMHIAQCFNIPGSCFFGSIDPKLRLFRSNMKSLTAPNVNCLGCLHRKLAPCTSMNICETGTLACENNLTLEIAWEQIKCNLNA